MVPPRLWIQWFRLVQLTLCVVSVDTKQVGVLPPTQTDAEAASSYLGSCRPFLSPIYPLPPPHSASGCWDWEWQGGQRTWPYLGS